MVLPRRKAAGARLARRRRVALTGLGVLASSVGLAPVPSGAAPVQQGPLITVTEITGPQGVEIDVHNSEITNRGSVLVETEVGSEERPAIWHRGSLTPLAPPMEPADWDNTEIEDMSERAQLVGHHRTCRSNVFSEPGCATAYVWTDGQPTAIPTDGLNGAGMAMNDRGQALVIRYPLVPRGEPYPDAFEMTLVWQDGRTFVPPPAGPTTWHQPVDINDRGQVAVIVTDSTRRDQHHAGIWQVEDPRGVVDLGTLPGYDTVPRVMNDRGHIAGTATSPDGMTHAVLWRRGEVVDLGALHGYGQVDAINDRDDVLLLDSRPEGGERGRLWRRGRIIDLGHLGGGHTVATALNDHGQVVGFSVTGKPHKQHAFLWQDGRMIDLGAAADPDAHSSAHDINERGQIIGEVDGRPVIWTVRSP